MRIAWVSPLPPASSGIADYSATLLPRLARRHDIELFHDGGGPPAAAIAERWRCRPVAELPAQAARFDLLVYQIGNSAPHHAESFRLALELPGVVVLHEFMLHHLVRGLTLAKGDAAGYLEEMRYAAGRSGEMAARRLLDTHYPVDTWNFPLFERLVDRSRAVVVHNDFARQRVLASRPLASVGTMPMPIETGLLVPPTPAEQRDLKARFGLDPDGFLLASFGFVTPHKRLEVALPAFARLRESHPGAEFVIVGECSPHYDLAAVLARFGDRGVRVVGRTEESEFDDWMRACDAAVNLRHPTGGETSASFIRLLAFGRPAIVNQIGAFAEVPEGACLQLPLDGFEESTLVAYLRALADRAPMRAALGEQARAYAVARHDAATAAEACLALLEQAVLSAPPLAVAVPPLAPYPASDPWPALLAVIGGELADLGLGESDQRVLEELAARLDELVQGDRQ
ncbi:MAG: glycosyltransferase family 4 protein [Thermoanaerobaculia bacterium]